MGRKCRGSRRSVRKLLEWFAREARDLPWREGRTPYSTWVSEVMLQQTTAAVVAPRYAAFMAEFPDLEALAAASEEQVLAAWHGLGYYRRARALHDGARSVLARHGGRIPAAEGDLLALPGIGAYTAAAIRALAFGKRAVPVDGNVARVLARFLGDGGDVSRGATLRRLAEAFRAEVPEGHEAAAAEALIELGALVCRPRRPDCPACPLAEGCRALRDGLTDKLPRRPPPKGSVEVRSPRALVWRSGRLLLVRRPADLSLLPGFWELPGCWVMDDTPADSVLASALSGLGLALLDMGPLVASARHGITHHRIRSEAWTVQVRGRLRGRNARFKDLDTLDPRTLTTETRKLLAAAEKKPPLER